MLVLNLLSRFVGISALVWPFVGVGDGVSLAEPSDSNWERGSLLHSPKHLGSTLRLGMGGTCKPLALAIHGYPGTYLLGWLNEVLLVLRASPGSALGLLVSFPSLES